MFVSKIASIIAMAGAVSAGPVQKREAINDGTILNYALTLEHLEDTFYREGLAKYTEKDFADAGFDSVFYNNVKKVSKDESDHVGFLTTALKGTLALSRAWLLRLSLHFHNGPHPGSSLTRIRFPR